MEVEDVVLTVDVVERLDSWPSQATQLYGAEDAALYSTTLVLR